jgi:hypothetical protein
MKIIGETINDEKIPGWASELYCEDLAKRYPSYALVGSTLFCAAEDTDPGYVPWPEERPAFVPKGKPDCKYTMTPIKEGEAELGEGGPGGIEDF